nr:DEAD/DEAH box helicase family protein [Ruminococcus sp.]
MMYNIIKKYCENENTNGLFLIDMPTGFGKTYSVLKYISDACNEEKNAKRKYFFITPLKKNLPVNELKKFFDETLKTKNFSEKVLVIKSNVEMVMENYPKIVDSIPDDIKKTPEYEKLSSKLFFLKKYSHNSQMREIYEESEYNFRIKIEPAFRKMLMKKLSGEFRKNKKSKLYAVKTDKKWQWLGKLYPTVFTDDYQIYFMSMDKFITRNSTIVEPSYM